MAARSVFVNLVNRSDAVLIRTSGSLSHGIWTHQPPLRIEAGAKQTWQSESNGVATGTEGEVSYDIQAIPGQSEGTSTGTIPSSVRTATTSRRLCCTRPTVRAGTATMRR
jgi:hypothetical protein